MLVGNPSIAYLPWGFKAGSTDMHVMLIRCKGPGPPRLAGSFLALSSF